MDFAQGAQLSNQKPEKESSKSALLLVFFALAIVLGGGGYLAYTMGWLDSFFGSEATKDSGYIGGSSRSETQVKASDVVKKRVVKGKKIGQFFVPSEIDQDAIDFVNSLENKGGGKFPIQLNSGELGKDNPFLK